MRSPEATIYFGGHTLVLHAQGVLYWPNQRTLIASDLHFEKSTFLARHGSFIPPYDTLDTLERLEQLVAHYQPERLILLGDSFHDAQAWQRLDEMLRTRIMALTELVRECIWIEGNHDSELNAHPLGDLRNSVHIDGMHFAHDATHAARPVIIGHYHPKARVQVGKHNVSGKCFIHSEAILVMPSFGSYTGGLTITHKAIENLFAGQKIHTHLIYRNMIYPQPADPR